MTKRRLSALFATTILAAAAPAFAQPGADDSAPAPAASAAPQTHDWNEVSHINGQLVKVGESNDYIKKFRKTVIATNPIGWVTGFYGISLSHALTDHIALRGDVNYINPVGENDIKLWEVGVGVPLYLRRTYQGAFLEPGFIVREAQRTDYGYDGVSYVESQRTDTSGGPQVLFGWQWTWDAGYTVALAAGAGRNILESADNDSQEAFFNGYFRVGYSF